MKECKRLRKGKRKKKLKKESATPLEDLFRAYSNILRQAYMPDTIIIYPDRYRELLDEED